MVDLVRKRWPTASASDSQSLENSVLPDGPLNEVFGGDFAVRDFCQVCKTEHKHTQRFWRLCATAFKKDEAQKIKENRKNYREGLSKAFAIPKSQCELTSFWQLFEKYEHLRPRLRRSVD